MDTTEEINGTYFYRGHSNVTPGELLEIIFLEEFCMELGIDAVSGAAILGGQPWLARYSGKTCRNDPGDKCYF